MPSKRFLHWMFCFVIILCSTSAFAQKQFGSVQGTVKDAEGQPIPGVRVTASTESYGKVTIYTDRYGHYRVESLLPGTYDLHAELAGFESSQIDDVRISLGNTTSINFVLEPEKIAEAITVQGESPLIDSTTTAVTHTVSSEIIERFPDTGDFRRLLELTPGVGMEGVAYGSSPFTSNRVWIDGMDVSNSGNGGIFFSSYPQNWIEEVQVIGNGAPAEYGNYAGVIGNFVTRSGGNQFHGLFETFFSNENLTSTNVPQPDREIPFKYWLLSTQVGGPIIRDKLWFFSGFQYEYNQEAPFGYDGVITAEIPNFITKLTFKPNQNNTIQGFARLAYQRIDGFGGSSEVLPEAASIFSFHESVSNTTWIYLLTPSTQLEGRFGIYWAEGDFLPRNGDIPQHDDSGIVSGNAGSTFKRDRFSLQGQFSLTHYAKDFLGSHEFKFGTQVQAPSMRNEEHYNGGFIYRSYYGDDGHLVRARDSWLEDTIKYNGDINQVSVYIQDSWRLNPNFTLSLGLRWDHNRGSTDRGVVSSTDPIVPRIGAIWTLRENKPIVIKVHYGDYYDAILGRQFFNLSDQQFGFHTDRFNDETQKWETFYHEQNFYSSAPDNKHPFVRHFLIGADHELPLKIAAGVHYIYRGSHNILEDVELNPHYEPRPFVNPITGETITVYSRPVTNVRHFILTNPEGLYRRYDGLEIYFNRQFRNHLAISTSLVFSKTRGNIPNVPSDFQYFGGLLNDPNQLINAEGRLVNDPAFAWKFSGVYDLPYGTNLGFFFWHESGDTWEPLVSLDGFVNQPDVTIFGLPRGSFRLPSQNILDLRVEKQFELIGGQFHITADIFNALNAGYAIDVVRLWDNPDYGQPKGFVDPRQIRLGLRYTF
jgi:hypothetical protein